MTINERVRTVREREGLTQKAFADSIGMARANLAQLEKGNQNPTIAQLSRIVKQYGVSYDWLIDGCENIIHPSVISEPPSSYGAVHREFDVVGRFERMGAEIGEAIRVMSDKLAIIEARIESIENQKTRD